MENELKHHGVKGQKWGVRRYQNADGSLKSSGKKRYAKESGKADKPKSAAPNKAVASVKKIASSGAKKIEAKQIESAAKKEAKKEAVAERKAELKELKALRNRNVKDMTDSELKDSIDRMRKEKEYTELMAVLNPKKTGVVEDVATKVVKGAVEKSGEQLLTQVLNHYGSKGLNRLIGDINKSKLAAAQVDLDKAIKKSDQARKDAASAKDEYESSKQSYKDAKEIFDHAKRTCDINDRHDREKLKRNEEAFKSAKEAHDRAKSNYEDKQHDARIFQSEEDAARINIETASRPEEVIFANNKKK